MKVAKACKNMLLLAGLTCACHLMAGTPPQPMLAAGNESNWDAYAKALARGVRAGTSARQTPDWLKTGYIYQIQPRAFTHEGTIKAATRKLPLVKDAGATVVYLMPVNVLDDETEHLKDVYREFKQPKGFYRTKDYFNTDPEFGTNEDRREFAALRKSDPAFSTDARLDWVTNSCPDAVLTYRKTSADGASKWLCAVNFRKVPVTVEIPGRDPFPLAPAEWKMFDEKGDL